MFKIMCDTACDYVMEYANKKDVTLIPLYVTFDNEHYFKEQVDIDHFEFYRRMIDEKSFPRTSLPSVQDYIDVFMPYVEQDMPLICICITTYFSGSYNSACNAKDQILENYPNARITVINSLMNSASESLFVHEAVRMRDAGVSYEDTIAVLNKMTMLGRIFFTTESLEYLQKGGRLGKAAVKISTALSIRPIIVMAKGEISVGGICRTRKKAKQTVLNLLGKYFSDNNLDMSDYIITVESGIEFEERDAFRKEVEETYNIKCVESTEEFNTRIGVVTACHTGPYPLGLALMPKYETLINTL